MALPDVFLRVTEALTKVGISYMLTGSFAATYYGAPRATQDIDFVISAAPEQLTALRQLLPENDYYFDLQIALKAHTMRSLFNVIDKASGWKIDLVIQKSRPFSQVEFERRLQILFHGTIIFIASAEDVIISKLEWAKLGQSQRQVEDVAGILRVQCPSLDWIYLDRWIAELHLTTEWNAAQKAAEPFK
jgi:hypothetical protein